MLKRLHLRLNEQGLIDLQTWMIESTAVQYRQRNIIERMFGWLKENRRMLKRFDKLAKSYADMVSLAFSMRCLPHLFSYRA